MDDKIREMILFVLEDENEGMSASLDGDLDEENKQMNRELIREHERIITEVNKGKALSRDDLALIADANEIHVNDGQNLNGHYREAVKLEEWLNRHMGFTMRRRWKS